MGQARFLLAAIATCGISIFLYLDGSLHAAPGRTFPPVERALHSSHTYIAYLPYVSAASVLPIIGGCAVFPSDSPWNRDISNDPVDPNSSTLIASIGNSLNLHPDFGANRSYGIPFTIVTPIEPMVPITFTLYGAESDPGPYPIPPNAPVEAGSDKHVLVVQSGACKLYEMFLAQKDNVGNGWFAGSGAVFNLNSNALRPNCWTSADAAGLPILPGLVRHDEVAAGAINHALRFTVQTTRRAFVHPATHYASSNTSVNLPPMGMRVRLKASYSISGFYGHSRVILQALKRYGMFVADNGSNWFISGTTDSRWNDADLNQLKTVPGSAFEVVEMGSVITQC